MSFTSEEYDKMKLKTGVTLVDFEKGIVYETIEHEISGEGEDINTLNEYGEKALKCTLNKVLNIDMLKPFDVLAKEMINVLNNEVFKQVIAPGNGRKTNDDCAVSYHYAAYQEHSGAPYDVSQLEGKDPLKSVITKVQPSGLQVGLLNMEEGEESYILIHPNMAYKEPGCSSVIQKNVWILFRVKLFAVDKNLAIDNNQRISGCDTFQKVIEYVSDLLEQGKYQKIQNGSTVKALKIYLQGIEVLTNVVTKDENGLNVKNEILMRCARNAAVCYNSLEKHRGTCSLCEKIEEAIDGEIKDIKLLYMYGKALRVLGKDKSLEILKKALAIEPMNKCVINEIKQWVKTEGDYIKYGHQMYGNLVEIPRTDEERERVDDTANEIVENYELRMLRYFAENEDQSSLTLTDVSSEEADYCVKLCNKLNLKYIYFEEHKSFVIHK